MVKRWWVYLKEMYPVIPRLFVGFLLFFEIYFLVLLTNRTEIDQFQVGFQEILGSFTIFSFLLSLRIADDFKDYETDLRLFPDRALPSGRVHKKDLWFLLGIVCGIVSILNLLYMNNPVFFLILVAYGLLMSFWFFRKYQIQRSLPLALVTHNPVQIIMNVYVISFAAIKYGIPLLTFHNVVIAVTLYFPGLIWELSRKIRAPEEETEYVTYSKLFGYKKPTLVILAVMFIDLITTSILLYELYPWAPVTALASYLWLVWVGCRFIKDPTRFRLVDRVEWFAYLTETTVVLFIGAKLLGL